MVQGIKLSLIASARQRMVQRVVTMLGAARCTVGVELSLYCEFKDFGHLTCSLGAAAGGVDRDGTVVVIDARGALVVLELLVVERAVGVGAVDEVVDDFVEVVVLELFGLFEQDWYEVSELVTSARMCCCGGEPVDLIGADAPGEERVANSSMTVDEVSAAPDFVGLGTGTVQGAFEIGAD